MRKLIVILTLTIAFIGASMNIQPPKAQAFPPVNPICWIADRNNAAIKEGCRSHNWSWPHWGGNGGNDGPARGCAGNMIYGQRAVLTAQEMRYFPNAATGYTEPRLVLVKSQKMNVRWGRDYFRNTWRPIVYWSVLYRNGASRFYESSGGSDYTVECR